MPEPGPLVALVGWPQEANVLLFAAWAERGIAAELLEPAEALARLGPGDIAVSRLDVLPTLDGVEPGLMELVGVDLFPVRGAYVVLELNAAAEFDGGYDLRGEDVYEAAADALRLPRVAHTVEAATG